MTQLALLKKRRTKIIATLGPVSDNPASIKQLIQTGANVFRLNMSHGEQAAHRETYQRIRAVADELGEPVAILADLCGPKIRTGKFSNPDGIELKNGAAVTVTTRDVTGEPGLIPSQYSALAADVKTGDRILLADGAMELRVEDVAGTEINCRVIQGGILKNHKGINLPGVEVSAPALTDKDRADVTFALDLGVDYIALSFVRQRADVDELRELITAAGHNTPIIAKIEKPEALSAINDILAGVDAIMIARGDLGVELSPEQVPVAQQQLITLARQQFKPVIVATQMLESMIENPRPTRAEVSDVSNAVMQGADAIMLSGETAVGAFPVAAVRMMNDVARHTETFMWQQRAQTSSMSPVYQEATPVWQAMANATSQLGQDLHVRATIVISNTGMSALTMSSVRPQAPILALTPNPSAYRRMALMWGILPVLSDAAATEDGAQVARQLVNKLELANEGQHILLVRGFNSDPKLNAPSVTVLMV
ncbi:MAG: pyruvate kinase [Gammaproteobacteria bacterium]